MFSSVAEVMGHPAYEAFKAHHDGCEQCQTALTLPTIDPETNEVRMLNPRRPDQPYLGVFEGFLSRDMCDEGFKLARACLTVDFEPGTLAVLPFVGKDDADPLVYLPPEERIELRTIPVCWATFKLWGFRCRVYSAAGFAPVEVVDLRIGGSAQLFFHDWLDAASYAPDAMPLRLRNNPIVRPPNCVFVDVRQSRVGALGRSLERTNAAVYIAAEAVVEPLSDPAVYVSDSELPSDDFVRQLYHLEHSLGKRARPICDPRARFTLSTDDASNDDCDDDNDRDSDGDQHG